MKAAILKLLAFAAAGVCCAVAQEGQPALRNPYNFPAPAPPRALPGNVAAQTNFGPQAAQQPSGSSLFLTLAPMTPISDNSGMTVGNLQYALVGPNGAVDFGVISVGGRLIPVPWQLISASGDVGTTRVPLTVNVDRQRLLQAPSLTVGQLPQLLQDPQPFFAFFGIQNPNTSAQGAVGTRTNAVSGAGSSLIGGGAATNGISPPSTPGQTNAISPPPSTGPAGVPSTAPQQPTPTPPNGQPRQISPPPDLGPASQGAPQPPPVGGQQQIQR